MNQETTLIKLPKAKPLLPQLKKSLKTPKKSNPQVGKNIRSRCHTTR